MRAGRILAIAALAVPLASAGCGQADEQAEDKIVVTEKASTLPDWLTVNDKIEPAVWLRSREVGHVVQYGDPEAVRLRRAIRQAVDRFYEDPRMIANRTSQTGVMLTEAGKSEPYVGIVTGLIDIADSSAAKKLYGQMCQHYLTIRKGGKDRGATIQQLFAAYKSSGGAGLGGEGAGDKDQGDKSSRDKIP